MDSIVKRRCLAHVLRSRILGLRYSSTTATIRTAPTPPQPIPPPTNPNQPQTSTHNPAPPKPKQPASAPDPPIPKPIDLQHYTVSTPPTPAQTLHSTRYFSAAATPPLHLWTAAKFSTIPRSPYPEVCFVGRSNVGKSSLLNALFGRPKERIARVSSKAGHTKTLNAFGVGGGTRDTAAKDRVKQLGAGSLVVVDTPGYGFHSRSEWGPEINKFFGKRRQLRMVFVLVDALHGVKDRDLALLGHFEETGVPYTVVLSKVDRIVMTDAKVPSAEKLRRNVRKLGERVAEVEKRLRELDQGKREKKRDILTASAEKQIKGQGWPSNKIGVDAVRWAVLKACGLDCDENGVARRVEGVQVLGEEEWDKEEEEEEEYR